MDISCHVRLKELREKHEYTQTTIAQILKTTQQQYHRYETGQRSFHVEDIKTLCRLYGVSSDYILGLPKGLDWPN